MRMFILATAAFGLFLALLSWSADLSQFHVKAAFRSEDGFLLVFPKRNLSAPDLTDQPYWGDGSKLTRMVSGSFYKTWTKKHGKIYELDFFEPRFVTPKQDLYQNMHWFSADGASFTIECGGRKTAYAALTKEELRELSGKIQARQIALRFPIDNREVHTPCDPFVTEKPAE